ncbi:hypothetical protein [Nonomuraea sp. NPDC049695]|uniref:hypothetical protein n=1 Tax=Nonomuraea sp. NPDC049695 TaxID=3154734 RepID=UPI00342EE8AF
MVQIVPPRRRRRPPSAHDRILSSAPDDLTMAEAIGSLTERSGAFKEPDRDTA